jgi:hypothetical protein
MIIIKTQLEVSGRSIPGNSLERLPNRLSPLTFSLILLLAACVPNSNPASGIQPSSSTPTSSTPIAVASATPALPIWTPTSSYKTPPTITNIKRSEPELCYEVTGSEKFLDLSVQIDDPSGIEKAYIKLRFVSNEGFTGVWEQELFEGHINDIYYISPALASSAIQSTADQTGTVQYQIFAYDRAGNLGETGILSMPFTYQCSGA